MRASDSRNQQQNAKKRSCYPPEGRVPALCDLWVGDNFQGGHDIKGSSVKLTFAYLNSKCLDKLVKLFRKTGIIFWITQPAVSPMFIVKSTARTCGGFGKKWEENKL